MDTHVTPGIEQFHICSHFFFSEIDAYYIEFVSYVGVLSTFDLWSLHCAAFLIPDSSPMSEFKCSLR